MTLKSRIISLEKQHQVENEPFFLPLFAPFSLDELFSTMADCRINPKHKGELVLIDKNLNPLCTETYEPAHLESLERKLISYNEA